MRSGSGNHQPFVARAGEIEVRGSELKLGVSGRNARAVLVFRDKTETRPSGQRHIWAIRSGWRVNPAAAGYKTAVRVVDDDHRLKVVVDGRGGTGFAAVVGN